MKYGKCVFAQRLCCECAKSLQLCLTLQPHGLWPAKLLCPWDSLGKNTGMGCHALLQGTLPNPGTEPKSLMPPALGGRFFTTNATCEKYVFK